MSVYPNPVDPPDLGLLPTFRRLLRLWWGERRLGALGLSFALVRQGLDAQRNELRERERSVRRRDLAEARQTYEPPLAPPSFSEGLAAFVSSRGRR